MVARRSAEELADDFLDGDPFLTPDEVAALFRVDTKTVARWAAAGKLPALKTPGDGGWRFRESVIRKQLEKGEPDGDQD